MRSSGHPRSSKQYYIGRPRRVNFKASIFAMKIAIPIERYIPANMFSHSLESLAKPAKAINFVKRQFFFGRNLSEYRLHPSLHTIRPLNNIFSNLLLTTLESLKQSSFEIIPQMVQCKELAI